MIKTLTKHGNSLALVIDKPVLDLLNIGQDTPISITTDGNVLTLRPVRDVDVVERDEKLKKIRDKVNKKYEQTFRKLAN